MENIVLQDERKEQIKIVDFGLSNIYNSDDPLRTHCGSPEYAAPELFVVGKRYGPEVDLWSLGVILYGMTTGRLPFVCPRDEWTSSEERRQRLMIQIKRGLTSIQERTMSQTSSECKNLINRLLVPIARDRISIQEVLDHPWIRVSAKSNFHLCSEDNLTVSDHLMIVNEIATAMRTTAVAVEAEIIRRKYGEIGGMYNIKAHRLHRTVAATYELGPRILRNTTCCAEDASPSTVTIRTTKDNFRNGTSRNTSCNIDHMIVMRHNQVQDRPVKKSSLHGSTTWNWRCHSDKGNHSSSEERRDSGFRFDTSAVTTSLSSRLCRTPQITKDRKDRNTDRRLSIVHGEETLQSRNFTSHANSRRMAGNRGLPGMLEAKIIRSPSTLQTYSRVSTESVPASRIEEDMHKKILIPPWRYRVRSARTRRDA